MGTRAEAVGRGRCPVRNAGREVGVQRAEVGRAQRGAACQHGSLRTVGASCLPGVRTLISFLRRARSACLGLPGGKGRA